MCVRNLSDPFPVAAHHGAVGHEFQQGAALAELVDGLLQVQEGLPFLQAPGQLAAPGSDRGCQCY